MATLVERVARRPVSQGNRDGLVERVARRAVAARGVRLNDKIRRKVNRELVQAGLDGNGRFEKPGLALAKAGGVLMDNGIEFDEAVHASRLMGDEGHITIDLAMSNKEDPYSPAQIANSMLAMTWHKHGEYKYEAVAYLS